MIGGWKQQGDLWQTTIPEAKEGKWAFRELFVNGQRAQRARHPNTGVLRVEKVGPDKRTSFTFKAGDIPDSPDVVGSELVFFHDWSISRVGVKSVDPTARQLVTVAQLGATGNMWVMDSWERNPRYFLENSRAFLDAPGEWFLDAAEGLLSYRPRPGESLAESEIIAPFAKQLLVINGDPTNNVPVRNLVFRDLAFEHNFYAPARWAGVQAGWHEGAEPGKTYLASAISLLMAEECRFENVRLAHLGTSGIHFGSRCQRCEFTRSHVTDISCNGIEIGEDAWRMMPVPEGFNWKEVSLQRPKDQRTSWHHPYRWIHEAPEQAATGNVIADNVIEHVGRQFFGGVGVLALVTRQTRIEYNEIRYMPYSGISMGWIWNEIPSASRDNLIQHNHIHHVLQQLSDGGGIYTLGRHPNSKLRKNLIHDIPTNAGRAESNGMFCDQGTSDLTIEENVIHNVGKSPIRFNSAKNNVIRANVFGCEGRYRDRPILFGNTKSSDITQEANKIVDQGRAGAPTPGVYGGGLSFGGSKGLDVPHDPALEPEELTLEAWVKIPRLPKDGDTRRWVAGKNGNEWVEGHYGIGTIADRVYGAMNIGGGPDNAHNIGGKAGAIRPDTWHQLVLTYDGTNATVYCDGEASGTAVVNRKRRAGNGNFAIAKRPDGYAPFECLVDEVAVFNRALAADEIATRYKQRGAANAEATADRVGYWGMNETGDPLKDAIAKLIKEVGPRATETGR